MKVLLTSGGTRSYIDEVRILTNLSTGTFGNHLCKAFLRSGHDVTFLYAKGSKCPHELRVDLSTILDHKFVADVKESYFLGKTAIEVEQAATFIRANRDTYHPVSYADFDDYKAKLETCLSGKPDIVVLAAAVSDYAPVKTDGKISSELDEMSIHLVKTPKLIRKVKKVLPNCFLVGFKLLVNSTQEQLEDAMLDQMTKAETDMVVGNDLRDIKANNHTLTVLSIDNLFYVFDPMSGDKLAQELVAEIVQDAETTLKTKRQHDKWQI
jgi:phosphopantothenoylcysteine synthetase/decarboxylase